MGIEIRGSTGRPRVESGESQKTGKSAATKGGGKSAAAGSSARAATSDSLNLTDKATQLQALEAQIANLPVVDPQRVEDVQHSLATGSYQPEPQEVADKMIEFETGLGKGQTR